MVLLRNKKNDHQILPVTQSSAVISKSGKTKVAEFANSIDPDEVAQSEPPHQDLHCLPSNL